MIFINEKHGHKIVIGRETATVFVKGTGDPIEVSRETAETQVSCTGWKELIPGSMKYRIASLGPECDTEFFLSDGTPMTTRQLLTSAVSDFEECFAVPTDSLPKTLQGRGKVTSLSHIRKKIESKNKKEEESEILEKEKEDKNRRLSAYAENPENIEYSQEREDLINEAYLNFGKMLESPMFQEREF